MIYHNLNFYKMSRGKTQNNNESINSLIWKLCPKTLGCGRKIVDISTNEAIVIFNDGNQGRLKIRQSLGLTVGQFAHKFVTLVDIKRIQTAEVHFNLRTKEVRQAKRMQFKTTFGVFCPTLSEELFPVLGEFVGVVGGQQLVFLERPKRALLDSEFREHADHSIRTIPTSKRESSTRSEDLIPISASSQRSISNDIEVCVPVNGDTTIHQHSSTAKSDTFVHERRIIPTATVPPNENTPINRMNRK
ncbi:uncharacterized protein TNCV_993761 [Trichonephila clavipes]|nr:uncharacterized protein TNCV_993761 [Trichonephila clavipes]